MTQQTKREADLHALAVALYDNDWEWLNTQAQREGLTLDAFHSRLIDDLYVAGSPHPPVDRPPKRNTVLDELVTTVKAVFGDEVSKAARARVYDIARRCGSNGPTWYLVFQAAYLTELRRVLQPQ